MSPSKKNTTALSSPNILSIKGISQRPSIAVFQRAEGGQKKGSLLIVCTLIPLSPPTNRLCNAYLSKADSGTEKWQTYKHHGKQFPSSTTSNLKKLLSVSGHGTACSGNRASYDTKQIQANHSSGFQNIRWRGAPRQSH